MAPQKILSARALALLLLLALLWGGSFLSIRLALNEIGPLWAVAHRTVWAALILWGWVLWRRIPLPAARDWVGFAGMGLLNNVIPFGLMAWGQLYIESGLTSILNAATALFGVLVAAAIFPDERLTPARLAGVLTGLGGVALAIGPEALASFDLRSLAQLAVLAGTISYAFASAWARVHLSGLRPEVAAAGMLTCASLIAIPAALALEGPPELTLSTTTLAAIAYYAGAATALAYLLYYRVLALAGAGNLMLVTLLIPPIAIVLGALVLGEALPPRAFAGFALIAAGMGLLTGRIPLPPRSGP
ncbi:DMT family transporter [Mesobacterium pallidum]|uniref:DMT family transporter n=1 Tax=Mesobacterium pallidum TaxID=2872037 RepID=UPI001EE2A41E|nr:DMT family transporter [Mesobacterium pallidum]